MASSKKLNLLGFAFTRGARGTCPVKGIDTTGHFRRHIAEPMPHGISLDVLCSPAAREDGSILPLLRAELEKYGLPIPDEAPAPAIRTVEHAFDDLQGEVEILASLAGETEEEPIEDSNQVAEYRASMAAMTDDESGIEEGTDEPGADTFEQLEARSTRRQDLMALLEQAAA